MNNTTQNNRNSEKYFKIVNIAEDGEITVLDELFEYADGFKGATGSKFIPVSLDEYNEQMNMDSEDLADYLIDSGFELPESHKKGGFISWAEEFTGEDKMSLFWDLSYAEKWENLREQAKLSETDAKIFNCVGGGRCFDAKYKGNQSDKLSAKIREYEKK